MAIEKADVIALLNKLKGAPAMIIFTEGTRMYTGIDDFYLFARMLIRMKVQLFMA